MTWRIDKVEISNLKFFYGDFPFDINRNNLLVFGENGAGKSSLFWCLHLLYHAANKSPLEAKKYFLPNHPENLRNRFADPTDPSGVKVTFSDGDGSSKAAEDFSNRSYLSNPELAEFLKLSLRSSDFLTAKQIAKIFDFNNSEDNEVFRHFRKEIFPLIDLQAPLKDLQDRSLDTSNAADWWSWLNRFDDWLPKHPTKKNTYITKCDEYAAFKLRVKDFNDSVFLLLHFIFERANEIIQTNFGIPVELLWEYHPTKFNEKIMGSPQRRTGKLTTPKIYLRARFISPAIKDNSPISHLRSFFNEAKISCMGIAFRFAVLEQRAPLDNLGAILAVDDLLNSMDMSVRKMVIPLLLDYQKTWQMFIFTHDRSLFHLLSKELEKRNEKIALLNEQRKEEGLKEIPKEKWLICEMYAVPDDDGIPVPLVVFPKSHLGQAICHLQNCRIPECANALRKHCESECKRLLPLHAQYKNSLDDSAYPQIELQALFNKTKDYLVKDCQIAEIGATLIDLDSDRKLLLNAFSHDDLDSQFYREELQAIIDNLKVLEKIRVTDSFPEPNALRKKTFRMKLSAGEGEKYREGYVDFIFNEPLRSYLFNGQHYHNSPEVKVVAISDPEISGISVDKKYGLRKVYGRLHNFIKPGAKQYGKDIISVL